MSEVLRLDALPKSEPTIIEYGFPATETDEGGGYTFHFKSRKDWSTEDYERWLDIYETMQKVHSLLKSGKKKPSVGDQRVLLSFARIGIRFLPEDEASVWGNVLTFEEQRYILEHLGKLYQKEADDEKA